MTSAFRAACRDLGEVARAAKPDPRALADRAFTTLDGPDYGHRDGLIALLAPALGETGLVHLRERVEALARTPVPVPAEKDRRKVGWSSAGAIYEDEIEASRRQSLVRLALLEITDALGDLDGYIAQHGALAREVPEIAADIANRLLAAGRAEEAWAAIENVPADRRTAYGAEPWREARIAVMEARGMAAEAQAFRWECFARFLDPAMLRAHLKRLPDFEDVEAEERALAHVQCSRRFHDALWFFLRWPDLSRAAALVTARAAELDGDAYALLDSRRRRARCRIPARGDAGAAGDDRFRPLRRAVEPLSPCGAAPARMPEPRRAGRGLGPLRQPSGLSLPSQGRARAQGRLLAAGRLRPTGSATPSKRLDKAAAG